MVLAVSEEENIAAIVGLLDTFNAEPYDLDQLPVPRPVFYNEVLVARRYGGQIRGEKPTMNLYRVAIRAVAQRLSNAREMRRRAEQIEGRTITVDGIQSTPIQFEVADTIGVDSGWYSGLTTYTYAI